MSAVGGFEDRFGDYLSPDKEKAWTATRSGLAIRSSVRGEVFARRRYGVFADIGVGFPALLQVTELKHADQRSYDLDDYPAVGKTITARVVAFNDQNRQIVLTQRNPHPYLDRPA